MGYELDALRTRVEALEDMLVNHPQDFDKGKAHPNTDYPDMSDETVAAEHSSLGVIDLTPQRPSPAEPADADDFPEEAWKEWTEDPCPLDETGLTTCFKDVTLTLLNNVSPEKCLGTLGALFMNKGNFEVNLEGQILFTDVAVASAVREALTNLNRGNAYAARADAAEAERDAALERVKELERRNYTLSDDKDEAEEDAEALEADRDTARADLAEALAALEEAAGWIEEAAMDACGPNAFDKAAAHARAFLAKHAKGGE